VNCACVGEIITIINENARNITHKNSLVLFMCKFGMRRKEGTYVEGALRTCSGGNIYLDLIIGGR
jgi:hypothetical protein